MKFVVEHGQKNKLPLADYIDVRPFRIAKTNQSHGIVLHTFCVELVPLTRQHLVVKTRFKLQPDCICDQVVCPYELSHLTD